jgi:hypothetical protein
VAVLVESVLTLISFDLFELLPYTLAVPANFVSDIDPNWRTLEDALQVLIWFAFSFKEVYFWLYLCFLGVTELCVEEASGFFDTNTSKNLLRGLSTFLQPSDEKTCTVCRHVINSSDFARVIAT